MGNLNMKEKENYKIIKEWNDRRINFKRAKLKLGYSERHMYRLKKILNEKGKDGFIHGNRGRKPKITIDQSLSDNILLYYQTEYQDFNFSHYKNMLQREKNIDVSYTKIYNVLTIKNNILSPKARKVTRKNFRKKQLMKKKENKNLNGKQIDKIVTQQIQLEDSTPRLPRSRYFGENIEIDASSYNFFGDITTHLHLSIETSSNTCTGAYLDFQETLNGYYHTVYQIFVNYGLPIKFTSDGRTIFDYISKKMKSDEKAYFTQFKRACDTLGIELIVTSKSQKKPRVEKYNQTFQDRLSKELHHNNITTIDEANEYLINTFIPEFNKLFGRKISNNNNVFVKPDNVESLNYILAVLSIRKFNNGNSISYKGKTYLPYDKNNNLVCYRNKTECTVIEAYDKELYVQVYNEIYKLIPLQEELEDGEDLENYFEKVKGNEKINIPEARHDWDKDEVNDTFEKINKEYKIYDRHNPRI
jgi:hypothetical protein